VFHLVKLTSIPTEKLLRTLWKIIKVNYTRFECVLLVPTNVLWSDNRPIEVDPVLWVKVRDRYHGSPEGHAELLVKVNISIRL
jgi:hypothetical protein